MSSSPSGASPLVSVVLPVYNHGAFLNEAIASCLTAANNLQLIVVNDGSTDPQVDAILGRHQEDSRITIVRQTNQGIANALNRGFSEARGELFTWTSADNRYHPGALDRLAQFLQSHPKIGMAYANVCLIDERGKPFFHSNYRINDQTPKGSNILHLPRCSETLGEFHDNFINACFLYRREAAMAAGTYNPTLRGYEDYDYWLRISDVSSIAHIELDEPLYDYRLHSHSLTEELDAKVLEEAAKQLISSRKKFTPAGKDDAPLLLRRARETNFGAVTSAIDSKHTVLAIVPDSDVHNIFVSLCESLLNSAERITVVLFCECSRQRAIADSIALKAKTLDFLRIIDISEQAAKDPYEHDTALLYALSSVDVILTVREEQSVKIAQREAQLAAMAGRNIVVCTEDGECNFVPAPHCRAFSFAEMKKNPGHLVGKLLAEASKSRDLYAMDQWLLTVTSKDIAKRIHSVLVSAKP